MRSCGIEKVGRRYLVAGSLVRKRARSGQLGPHRSLVLTAILDKRKCRGLRSLCGPLVAGSSLPLPFSLGDALAEDQVKASAKGSSFPLVSLIGNGLCSHGSRLSTVLLRLQRTRTAFLLVLHLGKCGLTLQLPRCLAIKPGEEALAAEPQEDDLGGRRLPCLSGASETSSLLVKEALAMCSLPLTFEGGAHVKKILMASTSGVLVEEPLAVGSLVLVGASGLLNKECLVLFPPQIVDGRLPIPVGAVRTSVSPMVKNGHPTWLRQQQSGSMLVFADGLLMPFFVTKRSTNVGGGVVAFVVGEQPLGGAWGGCGHLNCSHQDPPLLICGGGGRWGVAHYY
jgi:hypothetical protein